MNEDTLFGLNKKLTLMTAERDTLRANVVAFAGQLQAWGFDEPANQLVTEILGGKVNAPDYYALQAEVAQLKSDLENCRDERNREVGNDTLRALLNMNIAALREEKAVNKRLTKIISHDGGEGSLSEHCACVKPLEAEIERLTNNIKLSKSALTSWLDCYDHDLFMLTKKGIDLGGTALAATIRLTITALAESEPK